MLCGVLVSGSGPKFLRRAEKDGFFPDRPSCIKILEISINFREQKDFRVGSSRVDEGLPSELIYLADTGAEGGMIWRVVIKK